MNKANLEYGLSDLRKLYKVYNMVRELIRVSRVPVEERDDECASSRVKLQQSIEQECEYTIDEGYVQVGKSLAALLEKGTPITVED